MLRYVLKTPSGEWLRIPAARWDRLWSRKEPVPEYAGQGLCSAVAVIAETPEGFVVRRMHTERVFFDAEGYCDREGYEATLAAATRLGQADAGAPIADLSQHMLDEARYSAADWVPTESEREWMAILALGALNSPRALGRRSPEVIARLEDVARSDAEPEPMPEAFPSGPRRPNA